MNTKINVLTWFDARECKYLPKHFKVASTQLSDEGQDWVHENLSGRFYVKVSNHPAYIFDNKLEIYFEDPKELVLYELRWS